MINTYEINIGAEEIDGYGHVGYDSHLRWFKEGHRRFLESIGYGFDALEHTHGIRSMVRRAEIDYTGQLCEGDIINIRTDVNKIGSSSLTYSNLIERENVSVCKAKITVVFVNSGGRPVEIPASIRQKLQDCVEPKVPFIEEEYDDFGAPVEN